MTRRCAASFFRARRALAALVVVLLATATSVALAPHAFADSDGPRNGSPVNTAVVENTKDGSSLFKLAFQVRSISHAATVSPGNAAVAIASCTNCQTVAIAVQVVFVIGSPTVFTPENAAVAVNSECSFCDTLATAYQFIVQSSVPVRLTADGKHQLHDIHKALADLDGSGLNVFEIRAKVDELMHQLAIMLSTEVEPIPGKGLEPNNGEDRPEGDAGSGAAPPSTTTTVITSTSTSTSTSTTSTTTSSTSSSSTSSSSPSS